MQNFIEINKITEIEDTRKNFNEIRNKLLKSKKKKKLENICMKEKRD